MHNNLVRCFYRLLWQRIGFVSKGGESRGVGAITLQIPIVRQKIGQEKSDHHGDGRRHTKLC